MNACWKSLCTFAVMTGLVVFANGCVAEADVDTETVTDTLEATPDGDTFDVQGERASAKDSSKSAPMDSETGSTHSENPPPPPPTPPGGLCTGTSCTQI